MIFAKTIVGDKMLYWEWYLCVSWRQFAIYIYSIYLIADQQTKVHINRDVQFFNIYSIYLISDQQIKVHTETRKNKTFQKANTDTDRNT